MCKLQVSISFAGDPHPISYLVISGSPCTVSVSPDPRYFQTLTLDHVQSRACQKAHWKAIHKTTCSTHATIRQTLKESPGQKEWSRKITRWVNAWSNTISCCTPIALDLANHEWGRHDTHTYVPHALLSRFLIQSRREVSSCSWNTPVLTRTANCSGSGNRHVVQPRLREV